MKLKEYMNILNINNIDLSKVGRLRNIKVNGLTDYGFIDFIKFNGLAMTILNEKYTGIEVFEYNLDTTIFEIDYEYVFVKNKEII